MRVYVTTIGGACSAMISSWAHGTFAFTVSPHIPQSLTLWATTRFISQDLDSSFLRRQQQAVPGISNNGLYRASRGLARMSSSPSELPIVVEEESSRIDSKVTELPDSFEDSIARMGKATLQSMEEGQKLLRVDFDTTVGDETYTTLKSSLEMAKQLTKLLAGALICPREGEEPTVPSRVRLLILPTQAEYGAYSWDPLNPPVFRDGVHLYHQPPSGATLALFFPDAGSAALAKFEWGAGTETAQVPAGVRFCTVKTEGPADTDVGCILLCPRNSEADFALQLVKKIEERGQFMILVNPELINMGTTGYGLAGRRIRDEIISAFHTTYYLRTLPWGAVTREHGKWYSVWQDDANEPTGYRLLKTVPERPIADGLDDIYNIANGLEEEDSSTDLLDSFAKFVRDFGRL